MQLPKLTISYNTHLFSWRPFYIIIYKSNSNLCASILYLFCDFRKYCIKRTVGRAYFRNIYEEQPGEGIGTPWRRLWKNG